MLYCFSYAIKSFQVLLCKFMNNETNTMTNKVLFIYFKQFQVYLKNILYFIHNAETIFAYHLIAPFYTNRNTFHFISPSDERRSHDHLMMLFRKNKEKSLGFQLLYRNWTLLLKYFFWFGIIIV